MKLDRAALDETLTNMFSGNKYSKNGLFYAHIISQMDVKIDNRLPAAAGVMFDIDHYVLLININRFKKFNLNDRVFIIIHECLHVLMNHVLRIELRDHKLWNIANDVAINQLIKTLDVPTVALMPHNMYKVIDKLTKKIGPLLESSEVYYDLLIKAKEDKKKEEDNEKEKSEEDCDKDCNGDEDESNSEPGDSENSDEIEFDEDSEEYEIDTHETWEQSEGDPQLQKDVTVRMIERAIGETQKMKGNLPQEISEMLNMFTTKAQVNWKKVLKNIIGNKKIGKRPTIMRRSRRFPHRADIKGVAKDRSFDLVVLVDISGSMSTEEILVGLNEIHEICKLTKTTMKLIQIDTKVHKVEEFSAKTKLFERSGCGGTVMEAGIDYLVDNKVPYDALVYISDMWIEDVREWKVQPHGRTLWLSTSGQIPEWNGWNKHTVIPLQVT